MYVRVCYVYRVTVYVYVCIHICNYVYEFLLRYIYMCYLNRGSSARREGARMSIGRKRLQSIATKSCPGLNTATKIKYLSRIL